MEPEDLIILLHDLAARVGTASDEHEYGDKQAVWLENGRRALDYMEADERFSAASFKDSMEEQGVAVNRNDLIALIDNMRSLSKNNGGVPSENTGNWFSTSMDVEPQQEGHSTVSPCSYWGVPSLHCYVS